MGNHVQTVLASTAIAAGLLTGTAAAQQGPSDAASDRPLAAARAQAQLDYANGEYRCHMHDEWLRRKDDGVIPIAGGCPIQGDCDLANVRDGYDITTRPVTYIRLHFNVFRNDNGSNPAASEADVIAQVAEMNADFAPYDIQFTYTWQYRDDSTYRQLGGGEQQTMKNLYAVDPHLQCNVYVTGFGGGLGHFPWWDTALTAQGGIIIGEQYFGLGFHVMTHEMGHNLGLWHTHHGVNEVDQCSECYEPPNLPNNSVGDYCADTPPRPSDFGLCAPPGGSDPCSGAPWGDTQPENYMSYGSGDGVGCWTLFTNQQASRMHCWIDAELTTWIDCDAGPDCDSNGISDACEIAADPGIDANQNGIPDPCECAADISGGDGVVNVDDLLALLGNWGTDGLGAAIASPDNVVDVEDLLGLLAAWGDC